MQKITPHLWFDNQAKEAAVFYTSVFDDSKVTDVTSLHDTPSGDAEMVSFELAGYPFMAISAGPLFRFNPSISFHVKCKSVEEVDRIWDALSVGGTVLMKLDAYPFSQRYGWIQDKYGLSWQVIYSNQAFTRKFTPVLMFTGEKAGKAEEAVNFYVSVFKNGKVDMISRYGKDMEPDAEDSVSYAGFSLEGVEFGAMDSAREHGFTFNEAISFMVSCETQEEIDGYWNKLSAVPKAEQCGWLKDKYGVSWQIVPTALGQMLGSGTPAQIDRVTKAFLPMKKFDIAELQKAYDGK
jgi:predicted 3-demethylubiquinone-9 3-methyltransferase (glyoxalase superfamily)